MAYRVCPAPNCPALVDGGGPCPAHKRSADRRRGTAHERGYTGRGHATFRDHVLRKNDGICALCDSAAATVADHWPTSRRDLEAAGLNPNDPAYGRPLCHGCHSIETAQHQPGGWNAAK